MPCGPGRRINLRKGQSAWMWRCPVRNGEESRLPSREEDWIVKYRAALNRVQPEQSWPARIREALKNNYRAVLARVRKFFGGREQAQSQKPFPVPRSASAKESRMESSTALEMRKPTRANSIKKSPAQKTSSTKVRSKRLG